MLAEGGRDAVCGGVVADLAGEGDEGVGWGDGDAGDVGVGWGEGGVVWGIEVLWCAHG